jgi:hypothetical protein
MMRKMRHANDRLLEIHRALLSRERHFSCGVAASADICEVIVNVIEGEAASVLHVHRRVESKTRPATEDTGAGGP